MGLLDFLVTSNTRKDLLNLLWKEGVEASGHQLAQLSQNAYSTVHGELETMKREGLVSSRNEGRAEVFSKNEKYPFKNAIALLLEVPKGKTQPTVQVSDDDVRANLAKFGTPVVVLEKSSRDLSLEESLAYGLALARRDSNLARALPVAFARNEKDLELNRLVYLTRKMKALPVLGFYLDLTSALSKNRKLHLFAQNLKDQRRKKMEVFFTVRNMNKFELALAEQNTPPVARSWKFLMNMGMDSFESVFKKNRPERVHK